MEEYNFKEIEKKWQQYWKDNQTYKTVNKSKKPKFYCLDMFPYPSGSGLHVGHPLGYIASDIVARYKRLKGFNVLHPMGFDAFGLPAEQYAIQTGQHPAKTTEQNIECYKEQLNKIGFCYDWDREVRTTDPKYYKWTQWIFIQFYNSWYDKSNDKAQDIELLIQEFEKKGNSNILAYSDYEKNFSAQEWHNFSETQKHHILSKYRLAYLANTTVNWCPALGTVLSNDEVKDGYSERGGHVVLKKNMKQWMMRISAYAERLLSGLEKIDWSKSVKEIQKNWIGKSVGVELFFNIVGSNEKIEVFTTRIDTIFGVTFLVLAPEHELVEKITTTSQKRYVNKYLNETKHKSERERLENIKNVSGVFTGAYGYHPFNKEKIPIWIADYVLVGYGTGAVMAVPSGDQRDYDFAKFFKLPIRIINSEMNIEKKADNTKSGKMINSDFLDGLTPNQAIKEATQRLINNKMGKQTINYRMRDAVFTRQRYWGEPLPVYYKDNLPYLINHKDLPAVLPKVDKFLPTSDGLPPLARAKDWKYQQYNMETSTMPSWAASSWYFFRYMDVHNDSMFVSSEKQQYWQNVDLYIGGAEHVTGHLLYSRFWTKFLFDKGYVNVDEPFKKLINQGMIQGYSSFVYKINFNQLDHQANVVPEIFISKGIVDRINQSSITESEKSIIDRLILDYVASFNSKNNTNWRFETILNVSISKRNVDISFVNNNILNISLFRKSNLIFNDALVVTEPDGTYLCDAELEKMSKSKFNVINPDDVIEKYGSDTLRLYEMFLGPLEQSKPWNTNGIDGVFKFLKKFWKLFHDKDGKFCLSDDAPNKGELKILHKTLQKVVYDIDNYSFNTTVSEFMICTNELNRRNCNKKEILTPLVIALSPYAPHITEELWNKMGNDQSIIHTTFPAYNTSYLVESSFEYPISINGKFRVKMTFELEMDNNEIEKLVIESKEIKKWIKDREIKKIIIVTKKIINIVVQ